MDCLPHLHVAALHAPSEVKYHSFTPGIGVLCRADTLLAGAGMYSNSVGDLSKYAIVGWQPLRYGPWRVGAVAGVVDGYARHQGGYGPMGGLAVSYGALNVIAWPRVKNYTPAGLAISFTFSLK